MASRQSSSRCTMIIGPAGVSGKNGAPRRRGSRRRLATIDGCSGSISAAKLGPRRPVRPGRRRRVGHVQQLHLTDHHRLAAAGVETAAGPRQAGRIADGRDHRGLFDGHGDQVVAAVDQEVDAQAQRQGKQCPARSRPCDRPARRSGRLARAARSDRSVQPTRRRSASAHRAIGCRNHSDGKIWIFHETPTASAHRQGDCSVRHSRSHSREAGITRRAATRQHKNAPRRRERGVSCTSSLIMMHLL